jgi:hypothetical protein
MSLQKAQYRHLGNKNLIIGRFSGYNNSAPVSANVVHFEEAHTQNRESGDQL